MRGRKRKIDAVRDESGKSREHERQQREDYEARIARRGLDLIGEKISADYAHWGLAGFALGKLYLKTKSDPSAPDGISRQQYNTAERIGRILRAYSLLTAGTRRGATSGAAHELSDSEIARIRDEFRTVYDAIAEFAGTDRANRRAGYIVYGVCVDNWPMLSADDCQIFRSVLNHVERALFVLDKRGAL
jgi:hypothetical protein